MESFASLVSTIDGIVWGPILMVLILCGGLLLTVRVGCLQTHKLPLALKWMFMNEDDGEGEISSFGALCTALSATIGTGNIVGVATAVCAGGPGALFWMEVAAFFGMATKYAEGLLAVKYRVIDENNHSLGGPFYYIERGMGKNWTWMAKAFAAFGALAGLLGIGTMTQINSVTSASQNFFDSGKNMMVNLPIGEYPLVTVITAVVVTVLTAMVLIGGVKRIASVSEIIVPFMAVIYFVFAVTLVICNITKVPGAIALIVQGAFNPQAVTGGVVGSMIVAMQKGVARGIFSNEAGLGSAPIAAAAAMTKEPVRQGLVSMTGTFIDTIVICTLTGLSVILTGAWQVDGLEGVQVTTYAFQNGLPFPPAVSAFALMMCLMFFAFTTILGWDYYSERCLEYLTKGNQTALKIFRWVYILAVFTGPFLTLNVVWDIADTLNGLMAFPNMVALFALSGVVAKETKEFFAAGKHKM